MNEPVRIVSDWLRHELYGIEAVAAQVPLEPGDPTPESVRIVDETDTGWVARSQVPESIGKGEVIIAVSLEGELVFEGYPKRAADGAFVGAYVHEAPGEIVVECITRKSETTAAAVMLSYIMRAAHGSLVLLFDRCGAEARRRNGMELGALRAVRRLPGTRPVNDNAVAAALVLATPIIEAVPSYVP